MKAIFLSTAFLLIGLFALLCGAYKTKPLLRTKQYISLSIMWVLIILIFILVTICITWVLSK